MNDTYTMAAEERQQLIESIIDDIMELKNKQETIPACDLASISNRM